MNHVVAFAERARSTEQGGIVAAAALGKGAALLLGWHRDRLPRKGIAICGDGQARGPFRLTAWAHAEPGLCWFLAAVQVQGTLPAAGATIRLQAQGAQAQGAHDRLLAAWPAELDDARGVTEALASRATARPGDVALFLAELVEQAPRGAVLRSVLRRFLATAATQDGAVEIIGHHGTLLLLQGWGARDDGSQAIFPDATSVRVPLSVARFARTDIALPATGLIETAVLPEPWQALPPAIHIAVDGRLWRWPLVSAPQLLGSAETAAHLAEMLPRLEAEPEVFATLGRAARPPYEGIETVTRAAAPLAAALDLVAVLPGIGVYVSGWMLDPANAVAGVALACRGGFSARLDTVWTRIARPDVAAAMAGDRRFAQCADAPHGFAAFVPCLPPTERDGLYVAIDLAGGGVAYLPAVAMQATPRALMRRIAASIDLHKPTGLAVVETQLSPMLATAAQAETLPRATTLREPKPGRIALLLPLPAPDAPPAAMLSSLLHDPPIAGEETLLLVLGPLWRGPALAELAAVASLYGLAPGIVLAEESIGIAEAWELGVRATEAPMLLCMPAAGHAGPQGWRQALAAALAPDAQEQAVSLAPTLLYEDGSVRSAGFDAVVAEDAPPYFRLRRANVGLTRPTVATQRLGALLSGALVTRQAHRRGGGFAQFGLRAQVQQTAFFLRLADAGGTCRWLPEVAIVAPEAREHGADWHEAARLADGHALRTLWGTAGGPDRCAS